MRCEAAQDHFSDYCEGTLAGPLTVALDGHLQGCEPCRACVAELRAVWADLAAEPEVEAPPSLRPLVWQRIEAAERAEQARPTRTGWSLRNLFARPAVALAAMALVIVALGGAVSRFGPSTTAGLGAPWLVGQGAPAQVAIEIASFDLSAGTPAIALRLRNSGGASLQVKASVDGGAPAPILLEPDTPFNLRLPASAATNRAVVRIEWTDGTERKSAVRVVTR